MTVSVNGMVVSIYDKIVPSNCYPIRIIVVSVVLCNLQTENKISRPETLKRPKLVRRTKGSEFIWHCAVQHSNISHVWLFTFIYFWLCHEACGILVSQLVMVPMFPEPWKHRVSSTGLPGKSLFTFKLNKI